jgi:hypothetical protein
MTKLRATLAILLCTISASAQAALYDRGNGMIYDSTQHITWLLDANYAVTSGWAAANVSGTPNSSATYVQANGRMGQEAAVAWAEQLNYGGYDDWRLPSTGADPKTSAPRNTEIGHLYYVDLGNLGWPNVTLKTEFVDTSSGKPMAFVNIKSGYWFSEEIGGIGAWNFNTSSGGSLTYYNKASSYYAWAVRDGDVTTVPAPAAAWLFGSGLIALLRVARRRS